jgi:mono/diheme cytochrome c family protein
LQCHGPQGKGDGPVSKKYAFQAVNNHTIFIQVAEGRGDKPQWLDVLTEDEVWALTHINSL